MVAQLVTAVETMGLNPVASGLQVQTKHTGNFGFPNNQKEKYLFAIGYSSYLWNDAVVPSLDSSSFMVTTFRTKTS